MASRSAASPPPKLQLYSDFRSSCSWRVRIALNLKGLKYEYKAVNLVKGEQFNPEFTKLNPFGFLPVLVDDDLVLADSFAIILYLEEKYPQNSLLPQDLKKKVINTQAANIVCSGIQPFQNLALRNYIEEKLNADENIALARYSIGKGFGALEELLKGYAGRFATGDELLMASVTRNPPIVVAESALTGIVNLRPSTEDADLQLADLFLAPQVHAAIHKFKMDMSQFPLLSRLNEAYNEVPEFRAAMPDMQPDAPKS